MANLKCSRSDRLGGVLVCTPPLVWFVAAICSVWLMDYGDRSPTTESGAPMPEAGLAVLLGRCLVGHWDTVSAILFLMGVVVIVAGRIARWRLSNES